MFVILFCNNLFEGRDLCEVLVIKDALGFVVPSLSSLLAYLTNERAFEQELKNRSFGLLALSTLHQKVFLYIK
jgi:hypothetical protein